MKRTWRIAWLTLCSTLICTLRVMASCPDLTSDTIPDLTSDTIYDRGTTTARRPSVAVVLSGGGAKGTAHVGALRVIEQAGIPIDYVVGTSMGALIGGLYSLGYTTNQLDSLLSTQDWKLLLSDRENPADKPLAERLMTEQYALTVPFRAASPEITNGGFIKGVNLGHLFYRLLYPYNHDLQFDSLPIPFACVAVDIASGTAHEFHDGNLQEAMRASMSIPGLFTPVRRGEQVFVDGGIMNNYPMDVARKMGADIIIGVDVQADLLDAKQLKGLDKVLLQVIDVATNNDYFTKIDSTDIYIKVDVSGYSAASFTTEAIDTLKRRGQLAALTHWNSLMQLRRYLDEQGRERPAPRPTRPVATTEEVRAAQRAEEQTHATLKNSFAESSVNLSVRYDNLENVALLLGLHMKLPVECADLFLDLRGRLGERNYLATNVGWNLHQDVNLNVDYKFQKNNTDVYQGRNKAANITYYRHTGHLEFLRSWHRMAWQLGVSYDYYDWTDGLFLTEITQKRSHYYAYYLKMHINTLDDQWYPRTGRRIDGQYQLLTSNLYDYQGSQASHVLEFSYLEALSINRRVTFLPRLGVRLLKHPYDAHYPLRNFLGGLANGDVIDGQMTFDGLTSLQTVGNAMILAGLNCRGRISKNQYLYGGASMCNYGDKIRQWDNTNPIWGVRFGYMYKTVIGPVSGSIHYSDLTKRANLLVNIGYVF
jgi:NTE family protein